MDVDADAFNNGGEAEAEPDACGGNTLAADDIVGWSMGWQVMQQEACARRWCREAVAVVQVLKAEACDPRLGPGNA